MRDWKPGDVAMVKPHLSGYRSRPMLRRSRGDGWWEQSGSLSDGNVVEVRPLVVIDPESAEDAERLARAYIATWYSPESAYEPDTKTVEVAARQMQAALREFANPTPAKPAEPMGLGAVIEDADGNRWVRVWEEPVGGNVWGQGLMKVSPRAYADIAAVKVLSEGVTP